MLARYKRYPAVADTAVSISCDIAQFNERVSPIDRVVSVFEQLLEPGLVEVVLCFLVLLSLGIDQLERTCHNESLALLDTARQVQVYQCVAVDIVEPLPVRTVYIDGHLPSVAPILHILARERFCCLLNVYDDLSRSLLVSFGKIEVPMWGVYDVVGLGEAHK